MSDITSLAVALLTAGEVIALPTETVYGLAADADNPAAMDRLRTLKQRPTGKPFSLLIPDLSCVTDYATCFPDAAQKLAAAFWPGPLTLILPSQHSTIGLRIPQQPLTLKILQAFGRGVAAPSANPHGTLSPTDAATVAALFPEPLALIVDGGPCQAGIESTIVDLSRSTPTLLRAGAISSAQINAVLEQTAIQATRSHWAYHNIQYVAQDKLSDISQDAIVLSPYTLTCRAQVIHMPTKAEDYMQALYRILREHLEHTIYIVKVPTTAAWQAVDQRLISLFVTEIDDKLSHV